jgi:hypothetical protein
MICVVDLVCFSAVWVISKKVYANDTVLISSDSLGSITKRCGMSPALAGLEGLIDKTETLC